MIQNIILKLLAGCGHSYWRDAVTHIAVRDAVTRIGDARRRQFVHLQPPTSNRRSPVLAGHCHPYCWAVCESTSVSSLPHVRRSIRGRHPRGRLRFMCSTRLRSPVLAGSGHLSATRPYIPPGTQLYTPKSRGYKNGLYDGLYVTTRWATLRVCGTAGHCAGGCAAGCAAGCAGGCAGRCQGGCPISRWNRCTAGCAGGCPGRCAGGCGVELPAEDDDEIES